MIQLLGTAGGRSWMDCAEQLHCSICQIDHDLITVDQVKRANLMTRILGMADRLSWTKNSHTERCLIDYEPH